MRILELGKYYPPHRGGMESSLENLCQGLAARGHEVHVLVASDENRTHSEVQDGVLVRRLARWGEFKSLPILPTYVGWLRRELVGFRPDVIHLHLPNPLALWAVRWWSGGRPLVITYHSDIVRQRGWARFIAEDRRRVLRRARRIHVSSEALLNESVDLRHHRERCEVIPFGVDIDELRTREAHRIERWRQRVGEDFLLFVGRLVYYKGVDLLLEALKETTIPLVVVGDGPLRAEWQTLATVFGLGDQVHFVGEVSPESLRALYQSARMFVLPSQSRAETFGVVQLEAMAAGCPIVACRASGGVVSVHEEGRTARLVDVGSAAALREAIVDLWGDDSGRRELAAAALDRVRAFFDSDRNIARIEAMLDQVVSEAATGRGARTAP